MRSITLFAALLLTLVLAACGGGDTATTDDGTDGGGAAAPPAAGMCLEGATDCVDTVGGETEAFDDETARANAQAQLGLTEDELAPDVRVARRGDEQMMLTEDYVLGRLTVELDDVGDGDWTVTQVTVELLDGPETFAR